MPYAWPNSVSDSTTGRGRSATMAPVRHAVDSSDAVFPLIDCS